MTAWLRCTHQLYIYCILNHCSSNMTVSLNCQGADIFLAGYMDSLPNPLKFYTMRSERPGGGRIDEEWGDVEGYRLMCSYPIQSKISPPGFDVLP